MPAVDLANASSADKRTAGDPVVGRATENLARHGRRPRRPIRWRPCFDGAVDFIVTDVPGRERFEARDEAGAVAGSVTYQLTGNIIAYTHTEVDPGFEGRGVGSTLARAVMDDARAKGRTVVPICPFLSEWLGKHPEYADIVVRSTRKVK